MFDLSKITGIYCITCTATGRKYVGKTASKGGVQKRWTEHRTALNKGSNGCIRLQHEWAKYGREAFTFEVLEPVPREASEETFVDRETYWIAELQAELNVAVPGVNPMRGRRHSAETRAKMSERRRGRVISAETRARMSAATKGRPKAPGWGGRVSAAKSKKPLRRKERCKTGDYRKSKAGPVERVDPVTGECFEYQNPSEAVVEGFALSHIMECCRGDRTIHKGYLWGFLTMTF
jgi:group I intron endonuclease